MDYEFRPLGLWSGPETPAARRRESQFKAGYDATLNLLFREAETLGAKHLVLQVDLQPRDIRVDGLPRANARYGQHPGVVVSFDSKHGPLRYATDAFDDWRSNLRAIALSLEALRTVDRYGVSTRGEQYTGWSALPASRAQSSEWFTEKAEAIAWLTGSAAEIGVKFETGGSLPDLYKRLAKRMHPDVAGGSADLWERLDAAATLLELRKNGGPDA
jgi:hypothetical protein